jgi:NADP-reducing hydrogenase subunit HndD
MKIKVDGKKIELDEKKTLLVGLKEKGFEIPSLCYQEGLDPEERCRLCMIEINGKLQTSCATYPQENMEIKTKTEKVLKARKINTELIFSRTSCKLEESHELCKLAADLNITKKRFEKKDKYLPELGTAIIRDDNKCINCGRCAAVCAQVQAVYAIDFAKRGHNEHITPYCEKNLSEVSCIKCGQCIAACPVGAIREREHIPEVMNALKDKKKYVIVQTAPSIRVSLGEEFGMPAGTIVTGKMVAALRKCGFYKIFDTDLGADMTIMEESAELLKRITKKGPFPMITTCCPAWIKFMEHFQHDLLKNMSSCKSPHEMLGILIKTYFAKKEKINPKDIIVVSVMPCTAKKFESTRPELKSGVDYVLTTREAGKLIKNFCIDFNSLKDEEFDPALGISTGAGAMFGASGGVMEAALRNAYSLTTGKRRKKLEFTEIRGMDGIKEGTIELNKKKIRFAAANGLWNAKKLLEKRKNYDFIEIMACPGGCIGGGGQPLPSTKEKIQKRMNAIYQQDAKMKLRVPLENPVVQEIYKTFLDHPLSKKAHRILHTKYKKRSRF